MPRCSLCFGDRGTASVCPHCGGADGQVSSPLVLPPGALLAGQYRLGQVLGQPGGFGITYLAWDEKLETRVAIKEFFPRDLAGRGTDRSTVQPHTHADESLFGYGLQQFLQEARTLARFDHPNIVRVRNFFEANGTGYLVMDYYEGQSLSDYLRQQPGDRIGEDLAVRIMLPVLDGLRAVHAEGILHRDVDPHNIYLTAQGRVILLDFGAARMAVGDRSRSLSVILKPGYAPYEQYASGSSGKQGPWTDVYACAATLYRMVTGRVPTDAPTRVMGDTLPLASQVDPQISANLSSALQRALELRPEARPQSAREFQQLLMAQQPQEPQETTGKSRSTAGAVATAVVVGLFVVARIASIASDEPAAPRFPNVDTVRPGPDTVVQPNPDTVRAAPDPVRPAPSPAERELAASLAMFSGSVLTRLDQNGFRAVRRLLHDDFSSNPGRWSEWDEPDRWYFAVRGGRAYIMTRERGRTMRHRVRVRHQDVAIRFDLRYEAGSEHHGAGVVLREPEGGPYVAVVINGAGDERHYKIATYDPGTGSWTDLVGWTRADGLIRRGPNRVELIATGRDLALFINGLFARSVSGIPRLSGDLIGLYVDSDGVQYSFDNLVVVELERR